MEWWYYFVKWISISLRIMIIVKLWLVWLKKELEKRFEVVLGGIIFFKNFNFVCMFDFNILDVVSVLKLSWIKIWYYVIFDGFLIDFNIYIFKIVFMWWFDMVM